MNTLTRLLIGERPVLPEGMMLVPIARYEELVKRDTEHTESIRREELDRARRLLRKELVDILMSTLPPEQQVHHFRQRLLSADEYQELMERFGIRHRAQYVHQVSGMETESVPVPAWQQR